MSDLLFPLWLRPKTGSKAKPVLVHAEEHLLWYDFEHDYLKPEPPAPGFPLTEDNVKALRMFNDHLLSLLMTKKGK